MADSFWNVIGDVANTAAQDIGQYQQQKRELSDQHKAELRRQAQEAARREHEERSYQLQDRQFGLQERQFGETQRHNQAIEANRGLKVDSPNTLEAAYIRARETGDRAGMKEYGGLLQSTDRFRGPEPKAPPNYIERISKRAEEILSHNALQRSRESTNYRIPTTPLVSDSAAMEQAYRGSAGEFPRQKISQDSIRTGLGLPVLGAPSSGIGDLRMMDRRPAGFQRQEQGGPNRQELEARYRAGQMDSTKYAKWDEYLRSQGQ